MYRLLAHRLPAPVDAASAFRALFGDAPHAVWLDSSDGSGWSYLASAAEARTDWQDGDIFAELADGCAAHPIDASEAPPGMAFRLGWVGWFGYELWHSTAARRPRSSTHDSAFVFVDRMLAIDAAGSAWLVALDTPAGEEWLAAAGAVLASAHAGAGDGADAGDAGGGAAGVGAAVAGGAADAANAAGAGIAGGAADAANAYADMVVAARLSVDGTDVDAGEPGAARVVWRHDDDAYLRLVAHCLDAIARGDAYQLCLTNTATVSCRIDPRVAYERLRALSPTHHGGFLRIGDTALLSASPEVFLRVDADRTVSTRPIKGTRRRGGDAAEDAALRAELSASEKERAENLMIVDLMRNDLSRVARLGTVRVSSLLTVESYAQVHQLVSTVEAELAEGITGVDAVRALFPAGSMTGAPKIRAIELLAELERGPRGIYSGAFGYLGLDGAVELAMVIRSIVVTPDGATIGAGGGITTLSDPAEELAEMHLKAAPLLAALR